MSLISKIIYGWHYIRMNYHEELLDSCLDHRIKAELQYKYKYHEHRLEQISTEKAS